MESSETEWRDVPGYEGFYMINSHGDIFSIKKNRFLSPAYNRRYALISLSKNGVRKNHNIHRLVALAFLGSPPDENSQVDHIDGDKHNNNVSNLRWVTPSENVKWKTERRDKRIAELEEEVERLKEKIRNLENERSK